MFHADSEIAENELLIDVCQCYTPYQDRIDETMTQFAKLRRFERIDEASALKGAPLKYRCTYLDGDEEEVFDGVTNRFYRPASADTRELLTMFGTHVITQHYYGIYYKRSIKVSCRSAEARQQFLSRMRGVDLGTVAVNTTALAAELSDTNASFVHDSTQRNFSSLLHCLRESGHCALVSEFEDCEAAMAGAQNLGRAFETARKLHLVILSINRVLERLVHTGENFDHISSVIAVCPETHNRGCREQAGISLCDLGVASEHAWRALTGNLGLIEMKKAKKVDWNLL